MCEKTKVEGMGEKRMVNFWEELGGQVVCNFKTPIII
jgi:hypothetical protein